jgi:hypothetical protein
MRGYSAYEIEMASNVHPDEKMRGLLKDAKVRSYEFILALGH